MCGPIVVSLSLNVKKPGAVLPHVLYNAGRVTTYALLGGLMGLTGSFTMVASNMAVVQKGAMIFAGVLIMAMGAAMSGWLPLGRIFGDTFQPEGFLSRGFQRLSGSQSGLAYYPLGLLLGLLPCGPVYTALIAAARAGMESPGTFSGVAKGMGLMLAFGLGTVPALLLVAKLADLGWLKWRAVLYKVGAVLMMAVGIYFVISGIRY
jgi:sulfite exporter TauE/SafE